MEYAETSAGSILRFEKGEEVIGQLRQWASHTHIESGFFTGLGAVEYARIGYYDLARREYAFREYDELMEVATCTGNIAVRENEPIVHMHAVLGRQDWTSLAGHIDAMTVGVTLEVFVTGTDITVRRAHDDETGLSLMAFDTEDDALST